MKISVILIQCLLTCTLLLQAQNVSALSQETQIRIEVTKMKSSMKSGDYKAALKAINALRSLNIDLGTEMLFYEGKALFETGNYVNAHKLISKYIETENVDEYDAAINLYIKLEEKVAEIKSIEQIKRMKDKNYQLGMDYMFGNNGVEKNSKTAKQYLDKALAGGHHDAKYVYGLLIYGHFGMSYLSDGNYNWYKKYLIEGTNDDTYREMASYHLGSFYFKKGNHSLENKKNAVKYLKISLADSKVQYKKEAYYLMGRAKKSIMQKNKSTSTKDYQEIIKYYELSIQHDTKRTYPEPRRKLAEIYMSSKYSGQDISISKRYYEKAIAIGDNDSVRGLEMLKRIYPEYQ